MSAAFLQQVLYASKNDAGNNFDKVVIHNGTAVTVDGHRAAVTSTPPHARDGIVTIAYKGSKPDARTTADNWALRLGAVDPILVNRISGIIEPTNRGRKVVTLDERALTAALREVQAIIDRLEEHFDITAETKLLARKRDALRLEADLHEVSLQLLTDEILRPDDEHKVRREQKRQLSNAHYHAQQAAKPGTPAEFTRSVVLSASDGALHIDVRSEPLVTLAGEVYHRRWSVETRCADFLPEVRLNPRYLAESVKALPRGPIQIGVRGHDESVRISAADDSTYAIVMPMRL